MRLGLKLHPDSHCAAVMQIDVEVARPRPGRLALHYFVTGKIGDLRMPPVTTPARTDELWRHTCFEAFLRASSGPAYYEFNFAPSTQWAAYRFAGYRSDMRVASEITAPRIEMRSTAGCCQFFVALALDGLHGLPSDAVWHLGLSAVIEETNGRKSYWALAHPPGGPDFHHSDCFRLELARASES
jgi:hypothetical protein